MSTHHAVAMVKWAVFRGGPSGSGSRVYDYGSDQKRLVERVGSGGTLWLVTSRREGESPRSYHLAYKLVDCHEIDPEMSDFSGQYKYVVRSTDWDRSIHFKYNDVGAVLRRLKFASGQPMRDVANIGVRLLSIPELTAEDIALLERFEHKLINGRTVFLSYARGDERLASLIEEELGKLDVHVGRDSNLLKVGLDFREALEREARAADCFMVLVTPRSARSEWVHREVRWAMAEFQRGGLVQSIVPLVFEGGWQEFPELHAIHCKHLRLDDGAQIFQQLASEIASVTARKKTHSPRP